jgi:DHA2 family methylenomycin A resistance protein-like MFS transporter
VAGAGFALGAALLGFFVIPRDALIVSVALPAIGSDLGGGIGGLQWVVDGYTLMLAALLLMPVSFGGTLAVPAMTGLMLASVPAERAGLASGVLNTFRQVGGAVAVAVYGALVTGASFAHGMRTGLLAAAVLLAATAATAALGALGARTLRT